MHAGEWAGPPSVRAALDLPVPVARLGHGVRAVEDPALVAELAERGTVLEVCPTSNVVLGAYPSYAEHPFPVLRAAGVKVTLGSDDPPYWDASIRGEYDVAARGLGARRGGAAGRHPHRPGGRLRAGRPARRAARADRRVHPRRIVH